MNKIIFLLILFAVGSYFLGTVNFALIISKIKKTDIRKIGSGNPGTLNMSRNLGLKLGGLTLFLDMMKGSIPIVVSYFIFKNAYFSNSNFLISDFAVYMCGLSVVLGHIFPVYLKFRGGKGIATSIGVFLSCGFVHGVTWGAVVVVSLVLALIFIYFTEYGAMGSFIAITPSGVSGLIRLYLTYSNIDNGKTVLFCFLTSVFVLFICFFTWFAHRKNIYNMLSGDEHPTSIKQMINKHKLKK